MMIHAEQHGPVLAIRMARSFLGRPIWWTAAYWVDGVLIDTGPRSTAQQLVRALRQLQVDQIVLTHGHESQIGGLPEVHRAFPQAQVYAAVRTLPYLEHPERLCLQWYRRWLWGAPQAFTNVLTYDATDNVISSPNYTLRVVETPGHSPDHVAFFEPTQRWLFSGDIFLFGHDDGWAPEADLFGVISSLRTLDSLHPERLFSACGRVSRTPRPELHEKIGQLTRLARLVAQLDAAGLSAAEMVAQLFPKESAVKFWSFGHLSALHLVEACRSYNAIFTGLGQPSRLPNAPPLPSEETADASDSSTNLSADWGDLLR
jgi:glyoxylase-like metal-dependent hydrolase (beta-lactamase superfamily II)